MNHIYLTEIRAYDPLTGQMKNWCGPQVEALSWSLAEEYCRLYMGYCRVIGEWVGDVEFSTNKETNFVDTSLN